MTREEVIRGLEEAIQHYSRYSGDEYGREYDYARVGVDVLENALALLKAQEPVAPELQSGGSYVCGNCGMYTVGFMHPLTGESVSTWEYCGKCGKKVKWE